MTTPSTPLAPAAPRATPRTVQPWHWRLWQVASGYLPVLLMGLLAFGTWWVVKSSFDPADERPPRPERHEPDYVMQKFSVQRYAASGALQAHLEGEALRHYPDTDTLEIDQVRLRAVDAAGRLSTATARRAITNGEATDVQLTGGAEVVQAATDAQPEIRFRSESLRALLDSERVFSDQPVVVTQGGTEVRSDGMEYTRSDGVVRFTGRARATFEPRPR